MRDSLAKQLKVSVAIASVGLEARQMKRLPLCPLHPFKQPSTPKGVAALRMGLETIVCLQMGILTYFRRSFYAFSWARCLVMWRQIAQHTCN